MAAYEHFDFEGRYAFIDRDRHQGQARWVTLRLTDNYWFYIYEFPEKLLDIELSQISSAKKEKFDWSNESSVRFALPLNQEIRFFPFQSEVKTDELINKFNELKQRQEKGDEAKVGQVQKVIDSFITRMLDQCSREKYLDISLSGKDLFGEIQREMHTIGPHIPNIPHTPEECALLIRRKIEEAIANRWLFGKIDLQNNKYHVH